MLAKLAQICLLGALAYGMYWALLTLIRAWSSAPAEVPAWIDSFAHIAPWVLFVWMAVMSCVPKRVY